MGEDRAGLGVGVGVAPGGDVLAGFVHEGAEVHHAAFGSGWHFRPLQHSMARVVGAARGWRPA
jgi:hypothetical protein